MIECSSERIWYKNKRKFRLKFPFFFIITLILACIYYKFHVTKQIVGICKQYSYSVCAESSNDAVLISLSNGLEYSDLINIEKDSAGNISLMTANAYNINLIARKTAENTKKLILDRISLGVPIPWLAFLGVDFLSGYGKTLNFKYLAINSVNCEFYGEFKSVGINQTLHSIYLKVNSKVSFNIPFDKTATELSTSVLISENVLVGKVPDLYLGGNLFS